MPGIVDELRKLHPDELAERVRAKDAERERAQAEAEAERERIYPRWASAWRQAGFSRRHRERVWALHHQTGSEQAAGIYAKIAQGGTVVVLGPCGRGKTHDAAMAALWWCVENPGKRIVYLTEADLHARYVDAVRGYGSVQSALAVSTEPDLLVIDEVCQRPREAKGGVVDWLLERVVDQRYGEMLPTVLIGNQSRAAFGNAVGQRIVSRVQEAGGCVEYLASDRDWRKELGKELA